MSHWSSAPRRGVAVIHHTGSPDVHTNYSTGYCASGYNFFVRYNGQIVVCARWSSSSGAHALCCNCASTGIMMNGCFGGCSSGNIPGPSRDQECSVAYIISHLGVLADANNVKPHRNCYAWRPCCGNPTSTVCCGTNLTSPSTTYNCSAAADAFVNRVVLD